MAKYVYYIATNRFLFSLATNSTMRMHETANAFTLSMQALTIEQSKRNGITVRHASLKIKSLSLLSFQRQEQDSLRSCVL